MSAPDTLEPGGPREQRGPGGPSADGAADAALPSAGGDGMSLPSPADDSSTIGAALADPIRSAKTTAGGGPAHPIIVTEFVSLDGVFEAPGSESGFAHAGWTFKNIDFDPAAYEIKGREQQEAGAMLLGRKSFDAFAPVWPSMTAEFPLYNQMMKFVLSTTLSEDDVRASGWPDAHIARSVEEIAALRADGRLPGTPDDAPEFAAFTGPLIVHGSGELVQALQRADLVDRYHLLEFPVILGSGRRLWAEDVVDKSRLRLKESSGFSNGIRLAVLEVDRSIPEVDGDAGQSPVDDRAH